MEALLELEKVQRVLFLMGSRGLSDSVGSGGGSDRFLLFLVQLFDSLSMEKKVLLLSELLKKLDASNEHSLHQVPDNSPSSTVLERNKEAFNETSFSDVLDPLLDLFRCQGLMTNQLRKELKSGIEYWSLERKLC